ncbi:uridine kinase family protein [Pontiella sulfatireligans]|uniref:Vitamin B12-dependent ribonucleoside-diphosphate reductase n=1 Tax=Pontiella sulfatireligans TaxID=2750658 RepID=A0A6C2UVC7_9BACT|nr:ATP cone domain-containing protein [Pontiella sulfatireligans]VGO23067.1 Vitamin B12-dependent ribonucleoside-diphosphate reductase [Pontiella sulfatireligans]
MKGKTRTIIKRDGQVAPYDKGRIANAILKAAASCGGFGFEEAERLAGLVEQRTSNSYAAQVPTVEDLQDIVEALLMESGHVKTARAYIIYRQKRTEVREAKRGAIEATDNIPYKLIYEVLRWNIEHGCESVEGINQIIADGNYPDLVAACEQRYADECRAAATRLLDHGDDVRLVIVAGPSSSGKTTTTIKMEEQLSFHGKKLKAINVDHYFYDLEQHPKDEFGDYDYETPQALDIELINEHLEQLLAGNAVKTPHYNFHTGKRTLDVHEMHLADDEILLMDCLHGLYSDMTRSVPDAHKFRLYIETLGQLRSGGDEFMRWADHRLMRRMIRDSWNRSHDPMLTLTHWHYVRKSELQYIIPFIGNVDFVVNSAMPYEFPVLKDKLFHFFPEAIERYRDDFKRQDAYLRAQRVMQFLAPLQSGVDESRISSNSLFREFIGGSDYTY